MPSTRAVFLSYASEDAEAAERLATALRDAGIAAVWSILSSIAEPKASRHLGTAADAEEMMPWNIKTESER